MACPPPPDFIESWNKLTPQQQEGFKETFKSENTNDTSQIQSKSKSPFGWNVPEFANVVRYVNPRENLFDQVKATVEMIKAIQQNCSPRGLILNKEQVSGNIGKTLIPGGLEQTACVLGKGHSSKEVVIMKDRKTTKDSALKTVSISQFNESEVYLWIHLGDANKAPELYHFELDDNKVYYSMEIMTGKDLLDVIDEMKVWQMHAEDPKLARSFSLCVLRDLLEIQDKMRDLNYSHNDIHAGNIRLEDSLDVKIFDFGRAKALLTDADKKEYLKKDVVNLIRVFCCLYSGVDFDDGFEASKILSAKKLHVLNEYMIRISEEQREEMYKIMNSLFDTVRDWNKEHYADTKEVASYVESKISKEEVKEMKRRAAAIIFPDKYQHIQNEDSMDACNPSVSELRQEPHYDPIWDDENMEAFSKNVTDEELQKLGGHLH